MKKGFTLIEALVVIGILTIMFIILIPAYRSYLRRYELRQAAEQVRQALVEAQNLALAPRDQNDQQGEWYYVARFNSRPNGNGRDCQVVKIKTGANNFQIIRTEQLSQSIQYISPNNQEIYLGFKPPHAKCYRLIRSGNQQNFQATEITQEQTIQLRSTINQSQTISIILNPISNQIRITTP